MMMDDKVDDVVSLDDSPDTGVVESKRRGYKYARTEKNIITSDPATRFDENKRHQDLLRKIYEATSPDSSVNELIKEETEHYRYQDMLTFSAASGVDFFKMAPLSFALRDKYYFTPTIVSESILSDDQQAKKSQIRPKGFTVKLKQGGQQKEYRVGALFDLPYGGFAMQIGAAVQQIPAKSGKKTKNSVQLMMFSPNFMRLIEEYDQETGTDKGAQLIKSMQRMWGYQTHDHLHAIVRDFDDKPPSGFKRFDHALHHGRQLGGKDVLEGFGPFPITTPESNEYMSLLAVQEGWKIKFLADSKGFDFGRPTDSHAVRHKRMEALSKWVEDNKSELQNFDWKNIREHGKRYAGFVDEISDFDKGVREFADWAAKKKGDPKLQKDVENFCFVSYVHLALNILPETTPEIKKSSIAIPKSKVTLALNSWAGCTN